MYVYVNNHSTDGVTTLHLKPYRIMYMFVKFEESCMFINGYVNLHD
jgi:hypothetical protein